MIPGVSRLFVSWQAPESRRIYPIARLMLVPSGDFEFSYIHAALDAERQGFRGLPGFEDLARVYLSEALPPLFENRAPARGRRVRLQGEFEPPLAPANDALDAAPIAFSISRNTSAPPERLEAFAPPLKGANDNYWGVLVIRGVGRVPGSAELVERLTVNEALQVLPEPHNAYNSHALLVTRQDRAALGYVPDYLANELSNVNAVARFRLRLLAAHRLNFAPADPLYQVTCRYECDPDLGVSLFRSTAYEPLSPAAFRD
jgi:hypothetical protein